MSRAPITKVGSERLRAELERLKSVERPRIIAAVAEARAHGDLKENAEYHAAREQHGFNEGRIAELEAGLSTAEVIDVSRLAAGNRVVFGATVDLEDVDSGESVTYQIVGDLEADIKQRLIAVSSPIARALIGKNNGDDFEFTAPNGVKSYAIVGVRYS
ncbi:transcription elongation factor GreA [Dyella tabacisoli]|uniref:Transcription elongation factor GreA n=1 Tax=Dyella tabacisoli TaxID=2282381 RepID=A0A369USD4_9GAMM|nr:transcription elongation factor GreA [Dyella tabacisoli]RDD81239.1 transcription elongation factor GreA [Dyella tabacisoli]